MLSSPGARSPDRRTIPGASERRKTDPTSDREASELVQHARVEAISQALVRPVVVAKGCRDIVLVARLRCGPSGVYLTEIRFPRYWELASG